MATSWAATAREIMTDALTLIGVNAIGDSIPGDLLPLTLRTFNGLVKEMSLHGYAWPNLNLADTSVSWSGGTPSYVTAPADYSSDMFLTRTEANGSRIPLIPRTRAQWLEIPNKAATAAYPTHFYEDVDGKLYLYPVPVSNPGLRASYIQKPDDIALDAVTDFPAAAALALTWGLAAHLAPHFEIDPQLFAAGWVSKRDDLISNGVGSAPIVFELAD